MLPPGSVAKEAERMPFCFNLLTPCCPLSSCWGRAQVLFSVPGPSHGSSWWQVQGPGIGRSCQVVPSGLTE